MNDLTTALTTRSQLGLAPAQQKELQRSTERMSTAVTTYLQAINASSEVHDYAAFKAHQSLYAAATLRNAAQAAGWLTPEIDHQLVKLSEDYLRGLRATRHAAEAHLLQIANGVATGRIDGRSLAKRLLRG